MAKAAAPDGEKKGSALTQRRAQSIPASQFITVSPGQLHIAGEDPTRGWQAHSILYPTRNPTKVVGDPAFASKHFRNVGPEHRWVTREAFDSLTTALKAAGA